MHIPWNTFCLVTVRLFATPWTVARQVPLSMEFSRQEYWGGLPFPSTGDLPHPGTEPGASCVAGRFFITQPPGKTNGILLSYLKKVVVGGDEIMPFAATWMPLEAFLYSFHSWTLGRGCR